MFHALAAPARRAILDELQDRDGQTLFELCVRLTSRHGLGSTRQAISQHLDVLAQRIEALGIEHRGPLEHDGGDRSLYVKDPAGNVVEFWDFFVSGRTVTVLERALAEQPA